MVREKEFYRTLFNIALPAMLQSVISFSLGTADTVMVGQLGAGALAGVAVSNQVNAFLFSIIAGLSSGSAVLIAQYWGKKDTVTIKKVISFVFLLCCSIALLAAVGAFFFPGALLGVMTGDAQIITSGVPYFRMVSLSYILYAAVTSLAIMLRNVEVVMAMFWTSLVSSVMNLFFNWVFIFGNLGMPAMGAEGAALATVLSRICEFCVIFIYIFAVQKKFPLKIADLFRMDLSIAGDYRKHGMPIAIGDSQWAFVGLVKAGIIGWLGTTMVSANAIADTVMNIGFIASGSLSAGAVVVVGKAVGAGEYKKARQYSNTIQIIFASMAVVMASIVFLLRRPIVGLFKVEGDVGPLAVQMITIGAFTLLGTLYHASCFVGINRGSGDGRFVVKVDMICGWLVVIPLLWLSAHVLHLPYPLVYLTARIDQCFKWIIAFIRLRGDKWIVNVTRDDSQPEAPG